MSGGRDKHLMTCPQCSTELANLFAVMQHNCTGHLRCPVVINRDDGVDEMAEHFGQGWSDDSYPDSDYNEAAETKSEGASGKVSSGDSMLDSDFFQADDQALEDVALDGENLSDLASCASTTRESSSSSDRRR